MKTAQGKGHKAPAGPTREEQNENKNKNTQIYDIYKEIVRERKATYVIYKYIILYILQYSSMRGDTEGPRYNF